MVAAVRTATRADAAAVAAVQVATWQAAYRGLVPQQYLGSLSVTAVELSWATRIAAGNEVLVAPVAGAPRGFVSFGGALVGGGAPEPAARGPVGQVYALYVHPGLWGRGTGRALHDAALARLHDRGFTTAVLWVLENNQRARAFYERQGWWADGAEQTEEPADGVRLPEVRYRRDLPAG